MRASRLLDVEHKRAVRMVLAFAIGQLLMCSGIAAGGRRLCVGEKVPEFSATDSVGRPFEYKHGSGKPMLVAFLSGTQKRSADAAADIKKIVAELGAKAKDLDVIVVVTGTSGDRGCFLPKQGELHAGYRVLVDTEFRLWGRYGAIALPTVIISDPNDRVSGVKAGYAYDFAPTIRTCLKKALGIAPQIASDDVGQVKAATIDTAAARAMRHLQMARMLKKNGRLESAIRHAQESRQLDPNCSEAVVELGELYCQSGRGQAALEAIGRITGSNRYEKARVSLVLGWANRQMGRLDAGEKLLLEATALNPKLSRGFFELGKIYQARGQTDKAMVSYRRALAQLFDEAQEMESPAQQQEQKPNTSRSAGPQ